MSETIASSSVQQDMARVSDYIQQCVATRVDFDDTVARKNVSLDIIKITIP